VGPLLVAGVLEPPDGVQEVALVPDERAVQELVPAGLHPAFHDRVHTGHPGACEYDVQAASWRTVSKAAVNLQSRSTDHELRLAARVLQVHGQVPRELRGPCGGGVCGGAEDPDAPGGVPDDGEDMQARPGQCSGLEEVACQEGFGWGAEEGGPGGLRAPRGRVRRRVP